MVGKTPIPGKIFLGDGVFAEVERGMIKLTAEDGIRATNTIFLDHSTYVNLVDWVSRMKDKAFVIQ